jgi:hypothetical protein
MDEKTQKLVDKRLKDGWVRSTMMIEVLAVTEQAAKESLEKHMEKMGKEERVMVYNKKFHKINKVEKPIPRIPEAYSNLVEFELLTENFDKLVYMVMTYVPSSVEILEPKNVNLDMGELQAILNSLADLIHKFAAAGIGGVIIGT